MKKIIIALLGAAVFCAAIFSVSAQTFSDVTSSDFYYKSVDFLRDEGIVQGYSDGSFGYGLNINRAELLKIVVEAKFFDEGVAWLDSYGSESCFSDVPANEWYTKYICYALEADWVNGYGDGTFKPAQNINFVEALKIVLQIFEVDYPATEPWYKGIVETAATDNVIPLTISDFGQTITRAEMSDMITRKIKVDRGALDEFLGENKAVIVVTYDSISTGVDQSSSLQECTNCDNSCTYDGVVYENGAIVYLNECTDCECFNGELRYCTGLCVDDEDSIGLATVIYDLCSFEFNVIAGIYTDVVCGNLTYDLEEDLDFQALFPEYGIFISADSGILNGNKLYFSTYQDTTNQLIEYDFSTSLGAVLYTDEGQKLILRAVDLFSDVLVVNREADGFVEPACWSPWLDAELFAADIDGIGDSFVEYTVPQEKAIEEQLGFLDCTASAQ